MKVGGIDAFLRRLHQVALSAASDRELVAALVARRDESAFETLVERHGPMVLAVCQRMLHDAHDAEDAFQSTFLVLIRSAPAIRKQDAIASWLYGVAFLTARKARKANVRRRAVETEAAVSPNEIRTEAEGALDDEIRSLPEKYRVPLVLCELEGRSRKEVASQLHIPEGTLSSRLAKGRKMLAQRLRRNGWVFGGVVPAATHLPVALAKRTVEAGAAVLAGREAAGLVTTNVIALSKGVMTAMFVGRLKTGAAALIVLVALLGTGRFAHSVLAVGSAAAGDDQPPASTDRLERAKAELAAAEAARQQAQQALLVAEAQKALKEVEYRRAQALGNFKKAWQLPTNSEFDAQMQRVAGLFKHRIKVEIGHTESKDGGRIEILDVWGTRPEITIGGSYLVHGKYSMPSHERGALYFHRSSSDPRMAVSYDVDVQYVSVQKGDGEFTLLHSMQGPGSFHLHLLGQEPGKSSTLADVYFGTGDNVWRKR
jgi:RNA polymerase sigma factor (sigma-70 family)